MMPLNTSSSLCGRDGLSRLAPSASVAETRFSRTHAPLHRPGTLRYLTRGCFVIPAVTFPSFASWTHTKSTSESYVPHNNPTTHTTLRNSTTAQQHLTPHNPGSIRPTTTTRIDQKRNRSTNPKIPPSTADTSLTPSSFPLKATKLPNCLKNAHGFSPSRTTILHVNTQRLGRTHQPSLRCASSVASMVTLTARSTQDAPSTSILLAAPIAKRTGLLGTHPGARSERSQRQTSRMLEPRARFPVTGHRPRHI